MDVAKQESKPVDLEDYENNQSTKTNTSWNNINTNRGSPGQDREGIFEDLIDLDPCSKLEGLSDSATQFDEIQDVWISNFYESIHIISNLVDEYNYIAMVSTASFVLGNVSRMSILDSSAWLASYKIYQNPF